MARKDWNALQIEYIKAYARTGVSIMEWCRKKGINFATAKRYIKKPETAFAQMEEVKQGDNREVKAFKSVAVKSAKVGNSEDIETKENLDDSRETNCEDSCESAKECEENTGKTAKVLTRSQINSQNRTIHGGYAQFFKDKSAFGAVVDFSLKDEIDLMRQRAISAIESIEKFTADLDRCVNQDDKEIIYKLILSAQGALDRAVGRIESLNHTNHNIALILETIELRKAQTKETLLKAEKLKQELSIKSGARNAVTFNLEL